jgi:hypothetical protein
MFDVRDLLERQAAWQRRRAALTWPEKIRMAEEVREWAAKFSHARPSNTGSASAPSHPRTGDAEGSRGQQDK